MPKFEYNEAAANDPIRIEQVWAEKPGGGVVHTAHNVPATTPVQEGEDGVFYPILKTKVEYDSEKLTIKPVKGFELKVGDVLDSSSDPLAGAKLKVVEILGGGIYKIEEPESPVSDDDVFVLENGNNTGGTPAYITGNDLKAEDGEYQSVRLINGANVRKETAVITEEQAQAMKGIHLV